MSSNKKHGFTLVEILVVLGIIVLLAAILLPALGHVRENGKRTVCLSNLHQIGIALTQYSQDNDRRYPPAPAGAADPSPVLWMKAVQPQIKSADVFRCPSLPDTGFETSYWVNGDLLGKSDVRLRYPANVINLGEGNGDAADYTLVAVANATFIEPWDASAEYATRHLGGANYAFADGHVKWLNPDQITPTDDPDGSNFTLTVG